MNNKKVLPIAASLLILIVLAIGGFLFYRSSSINKKMDAFEHKVDTLKELRVQYSTGSYNDTYEALLDDCTLCLANNDTESITSLTDRIKTLKQHIISENKEIAEYEAQLTTFQNASSLYVIKGDNKTEYNLLLSNLEAAITKSDLKSCASVAKQLTELRSTFKTKSEQEADDVKKSMDEYKKSMNDYKKQLESMEKQLKKKQKSKTNSGQTNIYITPKTEKKVVPKKTPPDVIYVVPKDADFICPDSGKRKLTNADLCCLTKKELRIARNEIYARYGRRFSSKDLQTYFNSKSWYYGYIDPKDFNDDWLTKVENANVKLIKKYEAKYK